MNRNQPLGPRERAADQALRWRQERGGWRSDGCKDTQALKTLTAGAPAAIEVEYESAKPHQPVGVQALRWSTW